MPVWFERWLQGADTLQTADGIAVTMGRDFTARLPAGPFTRDSSATGHQRRQPANTKQMTVETAYCPRENARMR